MHHHLHPVRFIKSLTPIKVITPQRLYLPFQKSVASSQNTKLPKPAQYRNITTVSLHSSSNSRTQPRSNQLHHIQVYQDSQTKLSKSSIPQNNMSMLPNARLLARAFHRVPTTNGVRCLSNTAPLKKWEGRKADQHTTREGDHHNIQQDESRTAKHMKEDGNESSGAISEKDSKNDGKKAKEAAPKQPGPIIGMNDERGGVSLTQQYCET